MYHLLRVKNDSHFVFWWNSFMLDVLDRQ